MNKKASTSIKVIESRIDHYNKERDEAAKHFRYAGAHANDMISLGLEIAKKIIADEFKSVKKK